MKKSTGILFLYKTLFLIPILFIVVFLNYLIDPAEIFTSKVESQIVSILLNNKNVKYSKINYDERKFQEEYINKLPNRKNTIVIGSSRAMLLNSELTNSSSFFNNSVSGATIEDILAIFFIYYKRNLLPDTVFLALDPWMFNVNNGQSRWMTLIDFYDDMLQLLNINNITLKKNNIKFIEKYIQLISFSYFQSSLRFLINNRFSIESVLIETNQKCDDEFMVKHIDGSICYNKKYRTKDKNEINNEAVSVVNKTPFYSLGNFVEIDSTKSKILIKFIDFLKTNNILTILVLTPYHPLTYNSLINNDKYKIIVQCEDYIKKLAINKNIAIIGSYNPMKLDLNNSDFYDFMHPKEVVYNEIIRELF